jgi:hypothetical protein
MPFLDPQRVRPRAAAILRAAAVFFLLCHPLLELWSSSVARAASLRGSQASVRRQSHRADLNDFTRLRTPAQVKKFVRLGLLVPVPGNADYSLDDGVSYPVARPEVKLFVERLAHQYHAATGERLVVTSLTRPISDQPMNASDLSVHPAGMAVDFRRSRSGSARHWLERVLLSLEKRGVLEATRERHPPHYHVAVFPKLYAAYVNRIAGHDDAVTHRVRRGESLWRIARNYGSTVRAIKAANGLASADIHPGMELTIP